MFESTLSKTTQKQPRHQQPHQQDQQLQQEVPLQQQPQQHVPQQPPQESLSEQQQQPRAVISNEDDDDDVHCPICKIVVGDDDAIYCECCKVWVHTDCLNMSREEFTERIQSAIPWFCARCMMIKSNNIKWGDHIGEVNIRNLLENCYGTINNLEEKPFSSTKGEVWRRISERIDQVIEHVRTQNQMGTSGIFINARLHSTNAAKAECKIKTQR